MTLQSPADQEKYLQLLKMKRKILLSRDNLLDFAQYMRPDMKAPHDADRSVYQIARHHEFIAHKLEQLERGGIKRLIVSCPPRHGKALALDTPIPTPEGWTTMGALRPGDRVFDENGDPCNVVAVSPVWKDRPVYDVETDDGDVIVADANHEWLVRLCRKEGGFRLKTTEYLAKRISPRAPLVMAAAALNTPEADLPVDPYVLGVWLGDGRTNHAVFCSADPEIVGELERVEGSGTVYENRAGAVHFRPGKSYRDGTPQKDTLQGRLRAIGVLGNKHIPTRYLRAAPGQRLALLQGLVDTDGHVSKDGQIEFCTTSGVLAEQARELVASLGHKASLIEDRARLNGEDRGPRYRVMFYMQGAARLPRKLARTRHGIRAFRRYLSVTPAGRADTVCIEVDSPSHMFLAGRSMLPTHNSELAQKTFIPWVVGRNPEWHVMMATYNSTFAEDFGRAVRTILQDPRYLNVFPGVELDPKTASASRMFMRNGQQLHFVGRGGSTTGRGGHLLAIDDPIKDREEADSPTIRNKTWEWYTSVFANRQMTDDARMLVIMCMTGDTPVLMADGKETPLRDIRPGDRIATYEDGRITTSTVRNHVNQGPDLVYEMRMTSGTSVKANARHPFLVETEDGELEWRKMVSLKKGDVILRATGASGAARLVPRMGAKNQQVAKGFARRITRKCAGLPGTARLRQTLARVVTRVCGIVTASVSTITSACLPSRAASALFAGTHPGTTCERIGVASYASIIATIRAKFEDFSATTATFQSDMGKARTSSGGPLTTYSVTRDVVADITPAGVEDVYDIQVDRTENFIANGLVSHNTRWHEDDLVGRLTDPNNPCYSRREAELWDVVNLPALAEHNDPLGRKEGEPLWPERFSTTFLAQMRNQDSRAFSALYQGRPSPDDGIFFNPGDIVEYQKMSDIPDNVAWFAASDHAVSTEQWADKSCFLLFGVDEQDDIWIHPDSVLDKLDAQTAVDVMMSLMKRHKPHFWWAETGHISKSIGPFLRKRMAEERTFCSLVEISPVKDKQARAQSIKGRMSMRKVHFPAWAPWFEEAKHQILTFPVGSKDDFVDALSMVGLGLAMQHGRRPARRQMETKEGTLGWLKQQSDRQRFREELNQETNGWW